MHDIDAIVLAGGRGRRMQGKDKGLTAFQSKPLIAHVLDRISPQVDSIVISANRHLTDYLDFGYKVITDNRPDFQGPLAGIEACATHCKAEFTLIVSCDTPLLPLNLADKLKTTLKEQQCTASFADDGERQHYLCALVKTSSLSSVSGYLNGNQRSVKGWLTLLDARTTRFAGSADAFRNINQASDT